MDTSCATGKRLAFLLAVLLLAALFPVPAGADPYPSHVRAEAAGATAVRVTWEPNAWAQGYRIHRNNAGTIAEVPPDVSEYLDTGLAPGIPYYYMVASLVDGTAYWAADGGALVMPMGAPAEITSLSWHKVTDYLGDEFLGIELVWTPVDGAIGYEIFARTGFAGEFAQQTECVENSVLAGFLLPDSETTYFFKVRAAMSFYVAEADEYDYFTGPFSPEAYTTVPAQSAPAWETIGPFMTLQPPFELFPFKTPGLHIPSLTFLPAGTPPQLKTYAPGLPLRTNLLPVITPAPTLHFSLPVRTLLPVRTSAPIGTFAPVLKIRP